MKVNSFYPKQVNWMSKLVLATLVMVSPILLAQSAVAQSLTELPARYETVVENWSSEMDWSNEKTQQVVSAIMDVDNLSQPGSEWYVAKALYENLDEGMREELVNTYNYPMALMRGVSNRPSNAGPANRGAMRQGTSQRPGMQLFMQADLSVAQRKQLRNIQMDFRAKQADLMQNGDLTYEEFRGKMISLGNEKSEHFQEILNEDQFKEWEEMRSQRMAAQNSSRVARKEALSLNDETENELYQMHRDLRAEMRANRGQMARGGRKGGGAVNRSQRYQVMQEQMQEVSGLLSDKQEDMAIIKFALNSGWGNTAMMGRGANMMRRPGVGMRQGSGSWMQGQGPGMMQGSRGMSGSRGMRGGGMRSPGNCPYYNSYR